MSNNINNNFSSIEQMASMVLNKTVTSTSSDTESKVSFQDILKEAQAQTATAGSELNRITSYNVCYTKLLRT